jgi:hypothetical protein
MDENTPVDGDAVVNHLLGRIANLERELALTVGALEAARAAPIPGLPHSAEVVSK